MITADKITCIVPILGSQEAQITCDLQTTESAVNVLTALATIVAVLVSLYLGWDAKRAAQQAKLEARDLKHRTEYVSKIQEYRVILNDLLLQSSMYDKRLYFTTPLSLKTCASSMIFAAKWQGEKKFAKAIFELSADVVVSAGYVRRANQSASRDSENNLTLESTIKLDVLQTRWQEIVAEMLDGISITLAWCSLTENSNDKLLESYIVQITRTHKHLSDLFQAIEMMVDDEKWG